MMLLLVFSAYASPFTDCFEQSARKGLSCEFDGRSLQALFNDSRRTCAREGIQDALNGVDLGAQVAPVFQAMVNERIRSCGFSGEFKFNENATGGSLMIVR